MRTPPKISIAQCSEIGPKDRNDDSYGVSVPEGITLAHKGIAMAIADGMSSSEEAKEASEICVKSFLSDYYDTPESWTVQTAATKVLSAANRWMHAQGLARHDSETGLASTFSGLIFKAGTAHIFHIGDSRIACLRGSEVRALTTAHQSKGAAGNNILTRAMGAELQAKIDYRTVPVIAGDIYIFTTDGVHELVPDSLLRRLIDEAETLEQAARSIVAEAASAGSKDNMTVQLVRFDDLGAQDQDAHHRSLLELPFPPDLSAGLILDGYRIERELHASPRSQVYLAIDTETGEKVALKTPSANFADDPLYLEGFSREEWAGQTINSPYVAKTLVPAHGRKFLYTLVEYVEGQTLKQWMADNPKPKLTDVRAIIEQLIKGLRAFHRKEIVHQDLKPDNIMISREGTVKIVDFGSIRILGIEEAETAPNSDLLLGTASYSAPELILGERASFASDRYSLATIAYEMLTGALPYGKPLATAKMIRRATYRPAPMANREIPLWLDAALEKAVALNPASRQAALSEFMTDLKVAKPHYKKPTGSLIARDPLRFWKGLSATLAVLLALSLYF